jgi:hypothetical protein
MIQSYHEEPIRIWFGLLDWQLFRTSKVDPYFTIGASYDPIHFDKHFEAGLYFDLAGYMDTHPDYEYYGGGAEVRAFLNPSWSRGLNPYASVGYGIYHNGIASGSNYPTATTLAPRYTLGLQLDRNYFLEASYTEFGNHFNRDLGRFGVDIGIRF